MVGLNPSTQEAEAEDLMSSKPAWSTKELLEQSHRGGGHQSVPNIASTLRFSQGGSELVDENEDARQRTKVTPAWLPSTHY